METLPKYEPMNPEYKAKWLAALWSGNYSQGRELLYNESRDEFCCLGVLCSVSGLSNEEIIQVVDNADVNVQSNHWAKNSLLSVELLDQFGLTAKAQTILAELNDEITRVEDDAIENLNGFDVIADWIEENL